MPPSDVLRVALPVPLPRLFDYAPPPGHLPGPGDIGRRVRVPFGPRERIGIVAAVGPATDIAGLRASEAFLDDAPLIAGEAWESLQWLAGYLHAPAGEVIATALPAPLRRGDPLPDTREYGWALTEAGLTALPGMRQGRPRQLAEALQAAGGMLGEAMLDARHEDWRAAMRPLAGRNQVERLPMAGAAPSSPARPGHPLNAAQQAAADALIGARGFTPFLLDGVTGSGKTEVYLEAIIECLARGRQVLVLVPEIGLTPQLLERFRRRLPVAVDVLHSALNDGERTRTWLRAARGEARVVIGTRSAVFLPLPEAGLVIVDEEHDGSFKQFDGIRYHARDFALVRAKALDVPIVLGSATPALETLHNARSGRYRLLQLRERAGPARPPAVRVVDVRKRPLEGGLSEALLVAVSAALEQGGQVLVFRNRRGYAPVLLCHDCGWSAHCPRCSTPEKPTPMTVHAHGRRLQCHHCGQRRPAPAACPDCASLALQPQGSGTERIEEVLRARFPDVPLLRIDRGNTRGRDALQNHLAALGDAPGILVGTQMLAKGHDLPNLTLVAVTGIDEGLHSADFRSAEKLSQLLVQVAGRAGRAERPGEVLLQTHHPDHPLLQTLVKGGYHAFADAELQEREAAGFPPFAHLAMLRAEAPHADPPMQFLAAAKSWLEEAKTRSPAASGDVHAHGPVPAPHPRRAGFQRAQLLLSATTRKALHAALDGIMPTLHALPEGRKVRWSLDVDPTELY